MAHKLKLFISTMIVIAWAPVASAQDWAAAGFTGSVDEADTSIHVFGSNGAVAIRSSVARGTLNVRYQVHDMPVEFNPPELGDCTEIRANLRDTGPGARVIVRLMRLGIGGEAPVGELTLLAEIDSDTFPSAAQNRYVMHRACLNVDPAANLTDFTYFVDAQLIKTTATANPGLLSLQVCRSQDFCDP
jgi:hypothetical protein